MKIVFFPKDPSKELLKEICQNGGMIRIVPERIGEPEQNIVKINWKGEYKQFELRTKIEAVKIKLSYDKEKHLKRVVTALLAEVPKSVRERAKNCLRQNQCQIVADVVVKKRHELLARWAGDETIDGIRFGLRMFGLDLAEYFDENVVDYIKRNIATKVNSGL